MIRNRVYNKGETVYALISSTGKYNVLFPVKCIIHDVKHGDSIVEYQVRLIKFYDDVYFLKRYLFHTKFTRSFDSGVTRWRMKRSNFKTSGDFQNHLDENGHNYMITVDGPMVCKRRHEMIELFNKIQDFFVERTISDLYNLTHRSTYSEGTYHYESKGVFKAHLTKFLGERGYDNDKFIDEILYRTPSRDLDKL